MRLPLLAAALSVLAVLPVTARAQRVSDLIGRWEAVAVNGSAGEIVEITSDKKFIVHAGMLVRGLYRADSLLRLRGPDGTEQNRIYKVTGDTLLVYDPRGADVLYHRTPDSQSREGLVGVWSFKGPNGTTGYQTMRADSTWRMWIPVRAETMSYAARRNILTVRNGRTESQHTWAISDLGLEFQRLTNDRKPAQTRSYVRERQ